MSDHARISPSSLPALALCPGRLQACEAAPPSERDRESAASIDGTKKHALSYFRRTNPDAPWPTEVEGYQITGDDVAAVSQTWEYVKHHPAMHPERTKAPVQAMFEQRVEIGKYLGLPEGVCWGTADAILLTKDAIEIEDDKYGHRPVSPDSLQLKAYAVGAGALMYNIDPSTGQATVKPQWAQVRTVKLTILQPTDKQTEKTVEFPLMVLEDWTKELRRISHAALAPNAPRIPGETQCRYCAAASTCKERLEHVAQAMFTIQGEPEPMTEPLKPLASLDVIQNIAEVKMTQAPEGMSPEEIGRVLDLEKLITGWLQDIHKHAETLVKSGVQIPGWKLVEGRGQRAWDTKDEAEILKILRSAGVRADDCYTKKVLSPAQAEKVMVGRGDKRVVLSADKRRHQKLKAHIIQQSGAPKLVPANDPAPAINDAQTMFQQEQPAQQQPTQELPSWF